MCIYCEKVEKNCETENTELMHNMPIYDEFTEEEIDNYNSNPVQYIRRYKQEYCLVTEFANDDGEAIFLPIQFCPMCGRNLTI